MIQWVAWLTVILIGFLFASGTFAAVDTAEITSSPSAIREGETSEFTVRLEDLGGEPLPTTATVVVGVSGSATLGVDYEIVGNPGIPISLDFPSFFGTSSQTVTVRALTDNVALEGPEDVVLNITACDWTEPNIEFPVTGECPVGSSATVTIIDATPLPIATIEATDPDASKDGPDPGEFTVRLSTPAPAPGIQVSYSVAGTAVAGRDYRALTGSVVLAEGQSSAAIAVEPLTGFWSGNTTVDATLSAGSGYQVGQPASATVAIAAQVITATIEATDPDASKDGPDPGEFTVRLSAPVPAPGIQVSYSVAGTAVAGRDYRALTGSVVLAEGQSSAAIAVEPLTGFVSGDTTVDATLSAGLGYELGQPSSATVAIREATISLSIDSGAGQVASTGQALQPFVVKAIANGAPLAGVPILWSLDTGQGSLSNSRSVTGSDGLAGSTLTPSGDGEFVVKAQVEDSGESVEFRTLFNPLSSLPGLTPNQRSVARTVEDLCPRLGAISGQRALTAGEQDLLTQCNALIASSASNPGAAAQGVRALTPEQASAPRKLTTQVTGAQLDNIATRLSALRSGVRGISLRNLTFNLNGEIVSGNSFAGMLQQLGEVGGAASADDGYEFERLGFFVNGNIDWGDKDGTSNEDGFDFKTLGITAGMDYRFLEGLVLGFALGYGDSDVDIDADGGDLEARAWSSTLYGTYYATDHFYLEGSATYGWGNFDQTRNVSYSLLGQSREAKADFDGNQYAFMLGTGYDFIRGDGILDVYGRLRYVQADLDSYRESGASGLDLDIASQEATSFKSILGVNYTRSISTAKAVLVPQGWLEWAHEFENGDDEVQGFFANDPSRIPFALATDKFDTDYFRVGLGLGAQFGQGRTAFVSYEAALGINNYTEHTANVGVRLDF